MEKSEPSLAPEWLRNSGSATGGGSSAHHFASSNSDISSLTHNTRNRTSKSITDFESPRSPFLDWTHSSDYRRSLSSNAYRSFSRSHWDREREKEKYRSGFRDHLDYNGRVEMGALRRSRSMTSRKPGELLVRRGSAELKIGGSNNRYNGDGVLAGRAAGGIQKVVFDKDFPVLGFEERQAVPDIRRVSSPGLNTCIQTLPAGSSSLIGVEGWSSALAEVPKIIETGSTSSSSTQQITTSVAGSEPSSTTAGLNMAEALVQPPTRTGTPPQSSVKTQRLEELAIRQSRQLIPVTPSLPKTSVLNSSEKLKPKIATRAIEMNVAAKSGQMQPSSLHPANQSPGCGHPKSDAPKKFLILKPAWENGGSSSPKDITSRTDTGNKGASNPKPCTVDRKGAPLTQNPKSIPEKRPSSLQAQSRNDFFNLMRKKAVQDSGPSNSSPCIEESGKGTKEVGGAPGSSQVIDHCNKPTNNGGTSVMSQSLSDDEALNAIALYPDEEEAAFLRSLGWDENDGEGGLTEEEINAFYENYIKVKSSLKLSQQMELRLETLFESHVNRLGGASSEFGTAGSKLGT